jgi:tol-pal system protein YbgF
MWKKTLWVSLLAAAGLCGCASQDDLYSLDHRIASLERRNTELAERHQELETVASQVAGLDQSRRDDEIALRGEYAGLSAQLERLREEGQSLSGRLEEIEYLLNQKLDRFESEQRQNQERMDQMATDMAALQKRIAVIDQYLNLEPTPAGKPAPAPAGDPPTTDQSLYEAAKKAFDAGNYTEAREGFEKLLTDHPASPRADNAQFWIGETYYLEKWYEKAILEYQKVIENYPSGNKVPAALLKQGLSFVNIGEPNNARLIFTELIAKYPGTNEASIAKSKLDAL